MKHLDSEPLSVPIHLTLFTQLIQLENSLILILLAQNHTLHLYSTDDSVHTNTVLGKMYPWHWNFCRVWLTETRDIHMHTHTHTKDISSGREVLYRHSVVQWNFCKVLMWWNFVIIVIIILEFCYYNIVCIHTVYYVWIIITYSHSTFERDFFGFHLYSFCDILVIIIKSTFYCKGRLAHNQPALLKLLKKFLCLLLCTDACVFLQIFWCHCFV